MAWAIAIFFSLEASIEAGCQKRKRILAERSSCSCLQIYEVRTYEHRPQNKQWWEFDQSPNTSQYDMGTQIKKHWSMLGASQILTWQSGRWRLRTQSKRFKMVIAQTQHTQQLVHTTNAETNLNHHTWFVTLNNFKNTRIAVQMCWRATGNLRTHYRDT